jgi:hypothetical protein
MKKLCSILLASVFALSLASTASAALVQFDPTSTGTYSVTGIASFDWSNLGSVVIEQELVSSSNGQTTLAGFFNTASDGDTLQMNMHAQDNLVGFVGPGGPITVSGLDTNGITGGSTGYEVTTTLDAVETAVVHFLTDGTPYLSFTGINGTFQYYLDSSADSNIDTGAGYNSGDSPTSPFLYGTLDAVSGQFFGGTTGTGSNFITNRILGYDPNVIQVDPATPGVELIGSYFDSTIKYSNTTGNNAVDPNGVVGNSPYNIKYAVDPVTGENVAIDLILSGDSNSGFSAVPEPSTMILLGSGLIGLAGFRRKSKRS